MAALWGSEVSCKPCHTPISLLLQSGHRKVRPQLQQSSTATTSGAADGTGVAAGERGGGLSTKRRRALRSGPAPSFKVSSQVGTGAPAKQQLSLVHRPAPGAVCVPAGPPSRAGFSCEVLDGVQQFNCCLVGGLLGVC